MTVPKLKYLNGFRDTQRFHEDSEDRILYNLTTVSISVVLAQPGLGKTTLVRSVEQRANKAVIDWDKIQLDVKLGINASGWDIIRHMNDDYVFEIGSSNRIHSSFNRGYKSRILNLHAAALMPYITSVAMSPDLENQRKEVVILAYHPIQLLIIAETWDHIVRLFDLRYEDRNITVPVSFIKFKSAKHSIQRWKLCQSDLNSRKDIEIDDKELANGYKQLASYYDRLDECSTFFFEDANNMNFVSNGIVEVTDEFLKDLITL
jgi:hypothetical protein